MWETYKNEGFHHIDLFHGKDWMPTERRVLHFTSMTHRMGISKADMRGKCLLLHRAAATTGGAVSSKYRLQWPRLNNEGKKMTQMADKDRPCTPLRFLLPTPVSVFNFQSSTRMEEVEKGYCWEREKSWEGEERGGVKRGTTRTGKLWQPGDEQTGFKSNLQATGRWRGWGWVREQCGRHWDNQ